VKPFARGIPLSGLFLALLASCLVSINASALEIGADAPDFLLPGTDGKTYRLSDFAHHEVLVVVFTCNHCPTSQAYEDRLVEMALQLGSRQVGFVAISPNDPLAFRKDELGYSEVDDSLEGMKIRAARKAFSFPYLYDGADQNCSRAYAPRATPHAFVFDKARRLRYSGRIDNSAELRKVFKEDLRSAITWVLAGKDIRTPRTKVFGSAIKWSVRRPMVAKDMARLERETVSLKTLDTDTLSFLLSNKSKLLKLFLVWSPEQDDARETFEQIVEIHRRYRKRGLDVITIVAAQAGDKDGHILGFLKTHVASSRNYWSKEPLDGLLRKMAFKKEGPIRLPFVMLVKPRGEIIYHHVGKLNPLALKREILEVMGRSYSP
jgi:thiol-disulfide isomerase/thioredoxin